MIAFFLSGCEHEPEPFVDKCESVTYSGQILPLIQSYCAVSGCHVSGFLPGDFTTYEGLKEKAENGRLHLFVIDLKTMPPDSSFHNKQRQLFECWINQGALNN